MDTLFVTDVVHGKMRNIRARVKKSKNILEPDIIGLALLRCYNEVMSDSCIVGNYFKHTSVEQCLASGDHSAEETACLAKKIGESVIACIEHHRLQPLKETPSAFDCYWYDTYPNSVQIGRVLTATYAISNGLSENESFLKVCHFVPDLEKMLGEAVIKAVLEFRFGVSSFDDLFGMAVDAALDSKDIDEDLALMVRENGGPCGSMYPRLVDRVLNAVGVLHLDLERYVDVVHSKPIAPIANPVTKVVVSEGKSGGRSDGLIYPFDNHYALSNFRSDLENLPSLEVIVFKDVGAYQSAFEVIATLELPKLKLVVIDTTGDDLTDFVYDPAKMVADLRKCLGYRPRNNLILMVRHDVPHTEESWRNVIDHSIRWMIPGFEYTPCKGVFHMIE